MLFFLGHCYAYTHTHTNMYVQPFASKQVGVLNLCRYICKILPKLLAIKIDFAN